MPGRARRIVFAPAEGCHFLCSCKESNQRNTPPGREPMLRIGTLRSSARRGTVRELAALRHPHLFALAGPAVLGSLKADPKVKIHSSRSEEHTSELQSQSNLVCRLLLEKKKP